jgi:hypothetical protein
MKRRQAAVVACELAASSAGLDGQPVVAALNSLRTIGPPDPRVRQQLEDLVSGFDDEYLRLDSQDDPAKKSEAQRCFLDGSRDVGSGVRAIRR